MSVASQKSGRDELPGPVLLVGGAGRTGRLLAGRLAPELRVRVLARDPTAARERLPGDCELFEGNVLAHQTLGEAIRGAGAVVIAIAGDGSWENRPELVDVFGTRNVLGLIEDPAMLVVLVSSIAVTRPEHALDSEGHGLSWKAAAEELVRGSGHPYSIIRSGWLVDRRPRGGLLFGQGDLLDGRLSRNALADVCIEVLRHPEARGKTFEVVEGGDEVPLDWKARFAELELDTGWKKLVAD